MSLYLIQILSQPLHPTEQRLFVIFGPAQNYVRPVGFFNNLEDCIGQEQTKSLSFLNIVSHDRSKALVIPGLDNYYT